MEDFVIHLLDCLKVTKEAMEEQKLSEDAPILQQQKYDIIHELKIINKKNDCGLTDIIIERIVNKAFAHYLGVD